MKRALALTAALCLAALVVNGQALAIGGIRLYQRTLAPSAAAAGARCRLVPTCSHYAEAVIARDGLAVGTWRTARRVFRCGPWTPAGTEDRP